MALVDTPQQSEWLLITGANVVSSFERDNELQYKVIFS